jgi:hypothetical protein
MLRKAVMCVLGVALLLFFSVPLSFAASATSAEFVIGFNQYFVNNQTPGISMDAAPYIDASSGRTLVPVRYLGDALGATTNWDADTQEVTVSTDVYNVSMSIGSTTLTVDGQAQTMDVAPVIKDGRTYLPARWVANVLGYQVDWNAQYQIVIIWPNGTTEPMSFDLNTKNGDMQGQIADAQNILSQAKFLDPATVSKVIAVINGCIAGTVDESGYITSPNGGGVFLSSAGPTINNDWWFNIQMSTKPAPAGATRMLK